MTAELTLPAGSPRRGFRNAAAGLGWQRVQPGHCPGLTRREWSVVCTNKVEVDLGKII